MNAIIRSVAVSLVTLGTSGLLALANAQVPVDDDGRAMADYEPFDGQAISGNEDIPLLTSTELQDLVGPIALYPDDLLAIVLPASTYPLQIVEAQRFLQALENDPSLSPDEDWDDSVIALLNYPEVIELLNADLDWTWRLGEAVVAQQPDVVTAVESFRDRAYAAGNLKSDSHQRVKHGDDAIEITPVEDDIIYVPYYEPAEVVVYQSRPVYHYYPRAYPVYYYPYPDTYAFRTGYFWGVTTAFTLGWVTDSLHVVHHSYHGHPYYGHHYWNGWWYRRPTVHVHNHYYGSTRYSTHRHRYTYGDYWRPRYESRRRLNNQRITRSTYYASRDRRDRTDRRTSTHRRVSTASNYSATPAPARRTVGRNKDRSNAVSTSPERRNYRPATGSRNTVASRPARAETHGSRSQKSQNANRRTVRQDVVRSPDRAQPRVARRDVVRTSNHATVKRQATVRSAEVRRNNESRASNSGRKAERRADNRREANRSRETSNRRSAAQSESDRKESRGKRGGGSKSGSSRRQRH
jgi:hypothetical protein